MAQKFDIGLNSKINEFCAKFNILRKNDEEIVVEGKTITKPGNDDDVFENFGNFVVASNYLEEEIENFKSISTYKSQGIDGIAIIVNNKLVTEESDLAKFGQTGDIKIKIGFIQSTIQKNFDEQKFCAFTDEVVKFLVEEIDIEPYSTIYKKLLNENGTFIDRIIETPRISLFFLSGRTSHTLSEDKINSEKKKISSRSEIENKCVIDKYFVLQKNDIIEEFEKINKFHTIQIKFENNLPLPVIDNVEMSLLATVKFSELKKLILTSDNNLKDKLFVENVRNYIGLTPVNKDIKSTLSDQNKRKYFPFLNNGLVIICNNIERHPVTDKVFILTFPRIINGCQTTNELYKKYKDSANTDEINDIEVVAKVISTKDNNLKKMIIYAANNQNSIDKDLQSLNQFHESIETYFLGKDETSFKLYFERLRGQHSNVTPPYSKINIETLAKVYISVFLKKPHEMKSNALSVIDKYQNEGKIFNNPIVVEYYYCAVLWYWFNFLLINSKIIMKSKTMDMHILMSCDVFLQKNKIISIEDKLLNLGTEQNAYSLFSDVTNFLNSKIFLFERRGLYSNPKTEQLIKEILDGTITTTNQPS